MARPRKPEIEDLNLIPLMNLFVTMIPLLLLTAAFYHIGMISTSIPTQSEGGPGDAPTGPTTVTANVRMTDKGLNLTVSSADESVQAQLKRYDAFIPKKGKKHNVEALTKALVRIKKKYDQSDTMMLIPGMKSKYNAMVKVMDAARNMIVTKGGQKHKVSLFPVVVVTTLVE